MRLFFALPISRDWEKIFEHYRDRHGNIPYLRWTPLRNLHITVLFLGDVDDVALPEIQKRAREVAAATSRFALALERVQYAPPESRARMVWAYLTPESAYVDLVLELARTMSEISAGLDDLKRELLKDGANVLPHLTLARFRSDMPYPKELRKLSRTEREGDLLFVSELVLFESTLGDRGHPPTYHALDTFPFGV